MMSDDKAEELLQKYGKEVAIEIANMILREHERYADSNYIWRGEFKEYYTNAEKCKYWNEVIIYIKQ